LVKDLIAVAGGGIGKAAHMLGEVYDLESNTPLEGVPKNAEKAIQWFTRAAKMDEPASQHHLALLLEVGSKYSAAFDWYHVAADNGYRSSQLNLGVRYIKGINVTKEENLGLKYLEMAAFSSDKEDEPTQLHALTRLGDYSALRSQWLLSLNLYVGHHHHQLPLANQSTNSTLALTLTLAFILTLTLSYTLTLERGARRANNESLSELNRTGIPG
jgi:hypothetical protein